MLHIILLILKIIGIILLGILGILLLVVCCALFVPLRYRIEVSREEGEGAPPFVARAKVTWLLHLINVRIGYPADVYVRVRIFLFTVFRIPKAEKSPPDDTSPDKKGQKEKKKAGKHEDAADGERSWETGEHPGQDGNEAAALAVESGSEEDAEEAAVTSVAPAAADAEEAADSESGGFFGGLLHRISQKIRGLLRKLEQLLDKLKAVFQNIRYTIRRICDKIKSASDTIQYYKEVLESDAFRHSWELCKGQFGLLLKVLKPDQFEADLVIGTGDPASTGQVLALHGMLYPFLGEHVRIAGDFERAHAEGTLFVKGKIRAFPFLCAAWKVYRNKDIRTLIKLLKKEAV